MIKDSYTYLIQKLNMMRIRTDILKMWKRMMELQMCLDKIAEGQQQITALLRIAVRG
jgi:hypothetical protein